MSGGEGMGPHGCMEEKGLPLALNALSPQPGTWGKHYLDRGKRGQGQVSCSSLTQFTLRTLTEPCQNIDH